ncbi:MAG TPA: hypothetical protein VKB78_02620 [Pirellulales bacterium]|nr:hypothetical protein [Pirellulales bacterium]
MSAIIEHDGLVYADSKEAIKAVVRGLIDEAQHDYIVDRRKHHRHSLAILVRATPIKDGRFGAEFKAITHDIASGGICLVHNSIVNEPYLLLQFPNYNQQPLVMEVIRQTQIGPYWMIAGKFRPTC